MYYEEKIINGVLMCRTMPDGDWSQCSIEKMGQRIIDLEQKNKDLHNALKEIRADVGTAPYLLEALEYVHSLVCEGAKTGFNPHDGDWAEKLFRSNGQSFYAINKAKGKDYEKV